MTASLARGIWPSGPYTNCMNEQRAYGREQDAQLAAWSAGGDRRAFDEIVVRHGPFALRVAVRLIGNQAAAEDLVQEAMMRAWTKSHRFDPRRARFTTWFYRIIVNLCIDHRRKAQPDPLPDDFDAIDPAAGSEAMMEAKERRLALADALAALPARQRAAIVLVYDEGMSGIEAARVLNVSTKAVERLLARARLALRGRLIEEESQ